MAMNLLKYMIKYGKYRIIFLHFSHFLLLKLTFLTNPSFLKSELFHV